MQSLFSKNKYVLIIVMTLVGLTNAILLFTPQDVYAFPVEVTTDLTAERESILDSLEDAALAGAMGALVNGVSYFMKKIAYDGAKYLASGGEGQSALAFQDGFGSYLGDVAADSGASMISQFGQPFGLNLCKPPDIRAQISLQVSLSNIYKDINDPEGGPKPSCAWAEMADTWGNADYWEENYSGDALSERFAANLSVTEGDFGIALGAMAKIDRINARAKEANMLDRIEGDGFKAVRETISGDIRTPAQSIKEESTALSAKHQADQSAQQIAGIYAAKSYDIIPTVLSVFANTFVSTLLQNIMSDGLIPSRSEEGANILDEFAGNVNYNRRAAERAFSYFTAGTPQLDQTTYDIITTYSTCSDNPSINNCVMNNGMVQILQRAKSGNAMTIQEALDENLLDPNWKLLPPSREADNTDKGCYSRAFCYSNVQKLRKAEILPIGFEIAILKSDPDTPWTLGDVVKGFYACNEDNTPDPSYPYCHLIDPNWILKVPLAQCESKVYGVQLLSENTPQRRQECADFSTCLESTDTGSCLQYGYCTKEKNVWHIPGDTCPAAFDTCQTFINESNNQIGSYLTRSVDYGTCNIESVGCKSYSIEKDSSDQWVTSEDVDIEKKFTYGQNQLEHFNKNIAQYSCQITDAGCNLYTHASSTKSLYLKKAPDYLGCYDINPDVGGVQWAEHLSDLELLSDVPVACNDYAGVCVPEEVGCESYTPVNGAFTVTGIAKSENICPNECIGYETFKQKESNFEPDRFPLYFIPNQANECPAAYSGCDEFVDLSEDSGETLAYFSDVKICRQPEGDNANVYYTWEGSDLEGYVLKKHNLLKDIDGSPKYLDDAPLVDSYLASCNQVTYNILLENPYADNAAPVDCRAFYDNDGNVFYRLKEHTITVSEECTKYRKTEPYFMGDEKCSNNGEYFLDDEGSPSCIYWALVDESEFCAETANRCRTYIGNTGNNLFHVYTSSFEPDENTLDALNVAKDGWSGDVSVAPEATQVGLYSLRVESGSSATYTFDENVIEKGLQYQLSFWARGTPQGLSIKFEQTEGSNNTKHFTENLETGADIPLPVGVEWKKYSLGPIPFEDVTSAATMLTFERIVGNGVFFIDSIELTSVGNDLDDYLHLIKDSWKTAEGYDVPGICDSTPLDAFPGQHLGCQLYNYTRAPAEQVALNGFDTLCRSKAVGCSNVIDTYNTFDSSEIDATHKIAYKVLCQQSPLLLLGDAIAKSTCSVSFDEDKTYSCSVEKGLNNCYIDEPVDLEGLFINDKNELKKANVPFGLPPPSSLMITTSTVVIPADSDVQYLTQFNIEDGSSYLCNNQALGCQEVGLEYQNLPNGDNAYIYTNQFLRVNDPSHYGTTLCSEEQVGCEQFNADSQITYFKDPLWSGRPLCNYKNDVEKSGATYSGWFMDGVGVCSNDGSTYCRNDDECGEGNSCEQMGLQACYPDYLQSGGIYGLWSNASKNYDGFVGTCDSSNSGCTELIDPSDTSQSDDGATYYVIDNDTLYEDIDACKGGQVSQKEGCVLFNKTENPNKIYDSVATYEASTADNFELVDPTVVDPTTGDTNIVLKVIRDRQCSEWLACRSSITVVDDKGISHELCQEFQACSELNASGDCTNWVRTKEDNQRLTESKYISRGVEWHDPDYTGYSLFNKYNPSNFVYLLFPGENDAYLAYDMDEHVFFSSEGPYEDKGCAQIGTDSQPIKDDGDICGFEDGGRCYRQNCLYPVDGIFDSPVIEKEDGESIEQKAERIEKNTSQMLKRLTPASCKSHPEADSPFEPKIITEEINADIKYIDKSDDSKAQRRDYTNRLRPFEQAQVCQMYYSEQEGEYISDCSCDYLKIEYKDGTTDHWPLQTKNSNAIPEGVCSGVGDKAGYPCSKDAECWEDSKTPGSGICNVKSKEGTFIGQKGLCLEYDLSRPISKLHEGQPMHNRFACLTWLPIQVSASAVDIYNVDPKAGYNLEEDAQDGVQSGQLYCVQGTNGGTYYDPAVPGIGDLYFDNFGDLFGMYDPGDLEQPSAYFFDNYEPYNPIWTHVSGVGNKGKNAPGYGSYQSCPNPGDCYFLILNCDEEASTSRDYDGNQGDIYDLTPSQYVLDACQSDPTALYRGMSRWAWDNLQYGVEDNFKDASPNSIILRIEGGKAYDGNFGEFRFGNKSNNKINAFVPSLAGAECNDTGVVQHGVGDNNKQSYQGNSASNEVACPTSFDVSAHGPDSTSDSVLYKSPYEQRINRADIQEICFIPLMITDGFDYGDFQPVLLEDEICIGFYEEESVVNTISQAYVDASQLNNIDDEDDPEVWFKQNEIYFPLESYGLDGRIWQYRLEDTSVGGDDTIKNYNSVQTSNPKDKIAYRYIAVVYHNSMDEFPKDGGVSKKPDGIILKDPFEVDVALDDFSWFAIGADFNKDGEFLGYISRAFKRNASGIDQDPDDTDFDVSPYADPYHGVRMAVVAKLLNQCIDITSVYDHTKSISDPEPISKAWTHKTWGANPDHILEGTKLTHNVPNAPYGSLPLDADAIENDKILRQRTFLDADVDGIPYNCGGNWGGAANAGGVGCSVMVKPPFNYTNTLINSLFNNTSEAESVIQSFFAASFYRKEFEPISQTFADGTLWDTSDNLQGTKPPHIYSVNYAACDAGHCSVAEDDNMTLNRRNYTIFDYDNDGFADEDGNFNAASDPIIAYETYPAVVQFYAIADDDHMPIRRVMMDWGDGTPIVNDGRTGSYKNRKPYCDASNRCGGGPGSKNDEGINTYMTCQKDEDCNYLDEDVPVCYKAEPGAMKFGDADRACKAEYFEFTHMYYCDSAAAVEQDCGPGKTCVYTPGELIAPDTWPELFPTLKDAEEARDRLLERGLEDNGKDQVCVFKPGAQILDNWGWCNGECSDGKGNVGFGCYNGRDYEGGFLVNQCNSENKDLGINRWTQYNGAIIVIPPEK